jgi:hypothetical protein
MCMTGSLRRHSAVRVPLASHRNITSQRVRFLCLQYSPAMLLFPHTLPCTAKELLNIGRERSHRALVCAFIVEGIKFRASFCLAML